MSVSLPTQKELWALAGNQCAFPSCQQELVDPGLGEDGESQYGILGEVAHIRSHKPDGPRHDENFPADKLHRAGNLILLCPTHHRMVDGKQGANFSVEELLKFKRQHQKHHARRAKLNDAINAYLGGRYAQEDELKFHQAGLRVPSVEATFVDVVTGVSPTSSLGPLFKRIQEEAQGDPQAIRDPDGDIAVGGAQALLHPEWRNNAILLGGPGQGKSTLLQYVCQFHRAKRLGKDDYDALDESLERFNTVPRVPIRIDLRKYARWAAHQEGMSTEPEVWGNDGQAPPPLPIIEEYLLEEIRKDTGFHHFERDDLVVLFATEPILLALDGLDEVANIHLREGVLAQIRAMHGRLQPEAADLSIVVATRPGSSLETLTGTGAFPLMKLKKLSNGLRMQYLDKWVRVASLDDEAANRLRSIFGRNANLPHVQELAAYPMQLAILLDLLNTKQLLPQKRADLYKHYLETFLDREESEEKEPLLYEHRQVLLSTHAYIGWYLHCRAEDGADAGAITREELHKQLQDHLADHQQDRQLAEKIFQSISTRWLCLVERDEGVYEFEVQSLQEYFAALYMFDNLTPNGKNDSRDDGLMAMLERPHWTNVCRFFIGHYGKSEVRALRENLEEVEARRHPYPSIRSMGVLALNDRNFDHLSDTAKARMVEFILKGFGVLYSEDGVLEGSADRVQFGENAGRAQAVAYLKERLLEDSDGDLRMPLAKALGRHEDSQDSLRSWWQDNFRDDLSWLKVGAQLGVLRSPPVEDEHELAARISRTENSQEWITPSLLRGSCYGTDQTLQLVKTELNDGAVNVLDPPRGESPLAGLLREAWVATLHAISTTKPQETGDVRSTEPAKESEDILLSARRCSAQLRKVDFSSSQLADWDIWLSAIYDAWGSGWVLRLAFSVIPPTLDLSSLLLRIRSDRPELADLLVVEKEYRANAKSVQWWEEQLKAAQSELDRRWRLLRLLTGAKYQVVEAVADATNKLVADLAPKHYASIEGALRVVTSRSSTRPPMDIRGALRTNPRMWSGPALWLLRVVSTESSQTEINRALRNDLNSALRCGALDPGAILTAVDTGSKKVELDELRFTREFLSSAHWDVTRVKVPNSKKAKEILSNPLEWPRQLIVEAAEVHARASARSLTSMAQVATKNNWFVE